MKNKKFELKHKLENNLDVSKNASYQILLFNQLDLCLESFSLSDALLGEFNELFLKPINEKLCFIEFFPRVFSFLD